MKAVIFDFNGTLFDDTRFHVISWRRYMRKRFGIELTEEEVRTRFIGPNNSQIFRNNFGDRFTQEEIHACSLEKEAEYRAAVLEDSANPQLIEGAPALFDLLAERGIPFALATASELPNVQFYLNELGLKKWFTLERIVYDEGKLPSKPDPAFYLEAMRRLGAAPADCIVCEDSAAGIEAARRAGAGRIITIDRTTPLKTLEATPRIHAIVHDYKNFARFL